MTKLKGGMQEFYGPVCPNYSEVYVHKDYCLGVKTQGVLLDDDKGICKGLDYVCPHYHTHAVGEQKVNSPAMNEFDVVVTCNHK